MQVIVKLIDTILAQAHVARLDGVYLLRVATETYASVEAQP